MRINKLIQKDQLRREETFGDEQSNHLQKLINEVLAVNVSYGDAEQPLEVKEENQNRSLEQNEVLSSKMIYPLDNLTKWLKIISQNWKIILSGSKMVQIR